MRGPTPISIIVPIAPGETNWNKLLADLQRAPWECEWIFCGPRKPDALPRGVRWVSARLGRGRQLNAGARAARAPLLWFLHADTRLGPEAFAALDRSLDKEPDGLHFFDLRFWDGPARMAINTAGVWFRSHAMGLPFGDQGFAIRKSLFETLGEFRENLRYGEDHELVWRARRAGVPIRCTGASLQTSARKYRDRGWARVTLDHGVKTIRQGLPELIKLLSDRGMR
ncbi:MAG: glycosyl transferase family 2 [Bdellovibrionota bacterium]